jgi:hypothetical protein
MARCFMRRASALGLMLWCAASGSAFAQAPVVYGGDVPNGTAFSPVTDPHLIARCLCGAETVSARQAAMHKAQHHYDEVKAHAVATRQEVDRLRAQINPAQTETLDAYRRLLNESEAAENDLYRAAQPDYATAVGQYNQAVGDYNRNCAGQRFDAAARAQVARALICPAP